MQLVHVKYSEAIMELYGRHVKKRHDLGLFESSKTSYRSFMTSFYDKKGIYLDHIFKFAFKSYWL